MEVRTAFGVRKGSWSEEEDRLLKRCIENYGEGKWHQVPLRAGLNRCRKSCRLRWLNYLKPNIKRGAFSSDEVDLMLRLHRLLGNRWSLIAGRLPGRTANDVKNYWNTNMQKKTTFPSEARFKTQKKVTEVIKIIKPQPRTFSKDFPWLKNKTNTTPDATVPTVDNITCKPPPQGAQTTTPADNNIAGVIGVAQDPLPWWENMVMDMGMDNGNNWLTFDEPNFGNSISVPEIEVPESNSSPDGDGDWVNNFIEDNLEIWDLLGNEQVVI